MISAEEFSRAGSKYLGRSYSEMDCQKFYENCLRDCGLSMDLPGSNAWMRKFISTGWVGSPEECKAKFGGIPKGATLFIHAHDGGEPEKYKPDGLGNASHIGIKTGTGKGAIHSSASRGCVAESEFHDKTIRGGGWNMVGLSTLFDYGDKINRILSGGGDPDPEPEPEPPWDDPGGDEDMKQPETAIVDVPNQTTVNMRSKPASNAALVERIPHGQEVKVIKKETDWSKCSWKKFTGWIMNVYLIFDQEDDGDDFPDYPDDPDDGDVEPGDTVTIRIAAEDAVHFYSLLELIKDQIESQIGRGRRRWKP